MPFCPSSRSLRPGGAVSSLGLQERVRGPGLGVQCLSALTGDPGLYFPSSDQRPSLLRIL